jgi:hypothetical protein
MEQASVIVSDPEILGALPAAAAPAFYLEAGDTLDEFLDNFPSVTREAAISVLEEARCFSGADPLIVAPSPF